MTQYYLERDNEMIGPLNADQLIENGMTPDSLVWNSLTEMWCPATYYPDVLQQLQKCPAYADQQFSVEPGDVALATTGKRPMMGFWEAVKECWRNKFDFGGRARRSEYWWFQLAIVLGYLLLIAIPILIETGLGFSNSSSSTVLSVVGIALFIILVIFLFVIGIASFAALTRRLHDTNRSGWWIGSLFLCNLLVRFLSFDGPEFVHHNRVIFIGICLASLVVSIIVLVFSCLDSDKEENDYGPSPKYQ